MKGQGLNRDQVRQAMGHTGEEPNGGFTDPDVKSQSFVDPEIFQGMNVDDQLKDPKSSLHNTEQLIKLNQEILANYGTCRILGEVKNTLGKIDKMTVVIERANPDGTDRVLLISNISSKERTINLVSDGKGEEANEQSAKLLHTTYMDMEEGVEVRVDTRHLNLRPNESKIIHVKNGEVPIFEAQAVIPQAVA